MAKITEDQKRGVKKLYDRLENKPSYLAFRRAAKVLSLDRVLFVPFAGMVVGIEKDGYAHS